ncbi:MAG: hypothetical protein KC933_06875 [Myxococcales bacterium]|nr:hypothetical protein [Myxococcales bacterium]
MSTDGVKRLIQQYKQPDSSGKEVYWSNEIKGIWDEITKPEPGDQVGADGVARTISPEEAAEFAALANERMSKTGRRYYDRFARQVPGLLQEAAPAGGGGALTPADAKRPVFLNGAGWPVPAADVAGQPDTRTAEEGMYRLALAVSQASQRGGDLGALTDLPVADKAKLAENAISIARRSLQADGQALDGLTVDETRQLRSSAFTTLWALGRALSPNGNTARLSARIHGAMMEMADGETDKRLGQHMVRILDRPDYQKTLTANQAAEVRELMAEKIPQKFDVGNIMDDEGYVRWQHLSGQGEGFLRSFMINLPKKAVHGAKFAKVKEGWGSAEYELTFPQPRGEGGRVKGIRLSVREFRNDMFDMVGQKTGFSYGGHSNIGQNQEESIARAVARGLKAETPQIAMLDLCAGLDNLDDDLEKLGNLEVLTTFGSSYFWKGDLEDDRGEFEGVTRSEGLESLIAMFSSLTNEEDYEAMRGRVSDAIHNYSHERNPNVVFPTFKDYREVRWAHLDGDDDGRMDAGDVLYQFGLKQAVADSAREFVLQHDLPFDELRGDALKDAVLDLNVATHYNDRMDGNAKVEHKFISGGYFDGEGSRDLIRFRDGANHDGKAAVVAEFNSGLAHTSKEAMSALTQYMSVMYMADENKVRGLSEVDRKLMALTFAAFRLNYDGLGRTDDQRIWRQLLAAVRLPTDMPYGPLASLLDAEHHDYSGNMEIVDKYKAELSAETLAALEAQGVGRPGGGPPVA